MKSHSVKSIDRKLTLKTETLRELEADALRQATGGAVTQGGGVCELVSLALSCEIVRCF